MNIQNMEGYIIFRVFLTFIFCSSFQFSVCLENVARGKTASQNSDLIWNNFTWSADRAIDGCLTQADPDSSGCCSCNIGNGLNNYWKVNLGEKYSVINVTIIGRELGAGQDDSQLLPFQLFAIETADEQEVEIYDSGTQDYGNGIFYITFQQAVEMTVLVVRRPDHNLLTLCEVQAFADTSTTTTVAAQSTTPTEAPTQSTTLTEALTQSTTPTEAPTQSTTPTEAPTQSTTPTEAPTQSTTPTEAPTQSTTPTEALTQSTTPTEAPTQSTTPTEAPTQSTTPTEAPTQSTTPTVDPTQSSTESRATVTSPQSSISTTRATAFSGARHLQYSMGTVIVSILFACKCMPAWN